MLADVSKIRFQLFAVVGMALVIIACNILSPQIIGSVVGKADDFIRSDGADATCVFEEPCGPARGAGGDLRGVFLLFMAENVYAQ